MNQVLLSAPSRSPRFPERFRNLPTFVSHTPSYDNDSFLLDFLAKMVDSSCKSSLAFRRDARIKWYVRSLDANSVAFFIPDEIESRREEDSTMFRVANFIDGAYLSYMLRDEFSLAKIDFGKLARMMSGEREILRTYYYNCLPYQSSPPSQDERARFSRTQQFNAALQRIPRFEVRLGRLEFRGKKDNGDPIFEQKRVDILLGVDLALLAAKHQITDAVVLAGDSDFLPAIQAAKTEGVVLHLFHGQRPHRDLVQMCDERTRFTQEMIQSLLR